MEALYKMKKPKTGQSDRNMRAKLKDTASKSSRANLLDSKRRIPLSEVQPSNTVPAEEQGVIKKDKPAMSRAERLVEWKKQRDEVRAKQREVDKKNPPFRPGGKKPILKSAPVNSSTVANTAPPAAKKSAPSTSSTAAATQAKKPVKKANLGPSRTSARLAAKQPPSTSGAQRSTAASRKNTSVPESAKPRTKAQQTTESKKTVGSSSGAKPPVKRGQSGTSDVKGAASNKVAARKVPAKTQVNSNERRATTRSVASKTSSTKNSAEIKKGSVSKTKSKTNRKTMAKEVEETDSSMPVDPPTTPKKNSYAPIHPSPLLKRQVAPVRRETVYVPQFVNEPAWIPGAHQTVNFTSGDPNFDEAFKSSFSPFRFTAVSQKQEKYSPTPPQQQQQFVFEIKSLPKLNYDALDAEPSQMVASPPARKRRRSSRRCSRRLEAVTPLIVDSLEESSEGKTEETCSTESQVEEETTTESEEVGVDIGYFRGLHAGVTEKFTRLCQEWEDKSNKLEQEYTSDDNTSADDINIEDVLGQIRTTVCQAQLLMRKKLKQYIGLVDEAQDPTIEKRANADDLQSFWDMVYFQVEDVQKKFDAIEKLEKNGWKHKAPTPARKRTKKATKAGAKKAASSGSSSEEASERLQAARDKRQAQRNRLKEMKLAAKRAREQEAEMAAGQEAAAGGENPAKCQEDPLPVTPSPKKNKIARTPKVSSGGRQRRRSQRLLARSVFSPMESTRSPNVCVNEIPTGSLISLS